ncbi:hypothetical protein EMCRGX_G034332 [Ephydatia muelleri]
MVDISYMMQAVALQLFIMATQLSSAHDSEVFCNVSSMFYIRTCSIPEHSTVVLRVPEGAATWFKRSTDSPRSICAGSERCVLPRATRGDAGLYYAAVQLGPSGSAKYLVKLDVMIPPVLQNVVECDSSTTKCWTAATTQYWQDALFTISVAYIGPGTVTWTRSTDGGTPAPFICSSTPTRCTISSSTYQMVHYVNITLHNPYTFSEQNAVYTANVTNEAGFNTSSTQVNLLCNDGPDPPSSTTAVTLKMGGVGNLTYLAETKYQINVCYTSTLSNHTNCSVCLSWSEGPCSPMPGKPHWSISSTTYTTLQDCKQRSVSVIMDGVRADDEGTVNYYWVAAVTPELYQSYLVIVDATGTGLWVEIVVGVSAAGFLLIVAGIVVSLCARRRDKGQLLQPEPSEGQIQSETQPILVTEALQPPTLWSHPRFHGVTTAPTSGVTTALIHGVTAAPISNITTAPNTTAPAGGVIAAPNTTVHRSTPHRRLECTHQSFLRSDSIVSQPTSHVSLVPEEDECVEEV